MFAEELSGNAGRKRAEANRAKRRQMLQKKTSNKPKPASLATHSSPGVSDSVSSEKSPVTSQATPDTSMSVPAVNSVEKQDPTQIASTALSQQSSLLPTTTGPTSSNPAKKLTAVERAEEQRLQRALEAQQRKAALQIQAAYRQSRSIQNSLQQFNVLLSQRLRDLRTLGDMLKQKKGIAYVPPPATTTSLVRILLWIAYRPGVEANRTLRLHTHGKVNDYLKQMLQLTFLPSLRLSSKSGEGHESNKKSDDMNPFIVWMQSKEGRLRFKSLLHLCVVNLFDPKSPDDRFSTCLEFLHELLRHVGDDDRLQFVRSILNPTSCDSDVIVPVEPSASKNPNHNGVDRMLTPIHDFSFLSSFDLIATVRYYLLFLIGGPNPIPPQAEGLRQGCFTEKTRERAGSLVQFVWESQDYDFQADNVARRFLTHVLTVPLFVWKISPNALAFLLTSSPKTGIPPFLTMIFAFHRYLSTQGSPLDLLLPSYDVPLTCCPATNTQCLLANLVQMGKLSAHVNGSSLNTINFSWAQSYADLLSMLLDAIPVRTFSTRESAVEWISDGNGHSTPIVLSVVVLDQCRALFVDSFVRNLFSCAIDAKSLDLEKQLLTKTEKDKEMEKDIANEAGLSAISLAAKESRMDRNKNFWNSSKWARKLSKGVAGLLSSSSSGSAKPKGKPKDGNDGVLRNTSSQSRSLASGSDEADKDSVLTGGSRSREDYTPELLFSLCAMFSVVIARWGGGGGRDEIAGKVASEQRKEKRKDKETATAFPEAFTLALLNTLCFSTQLVKATWCLIQSHQSTVKAVQEVLEGQIPLREVSCIPRQGQTKKPVGSSATTGSSWGTNRGAAVLYIFVAALAHTLIVTDDVEIHDFDRPLPLHQLRRVMKILKKLLHRACSLDLKVSSGTSPTYFGLALVSSSSRSFRDLYDRSSRRPLCLPKAWLEPGLLDKEISACSSHADYVSLLKAEPVLRICPMLVSFKRRLSLFDKIIRSNREELQGVNSSNPFHSNPLKPARVAVITRGRILEDGLATMNHLGPRMRERIAVHYVNEAGVKETGIDAGGLFKEFWTDLCRIAFDPNYALFQVTEGAGNCMYPSPMSKSAHGQDHLVLFEFLGRIL